MHRKTGRSNILWRIAELETRLTDASGLVPHSQEWLDYWILQVSNYAAGREHAPLTIEGVRAVMQVCDPDGANVFGREACEDEPCASLNGAGNHEDHHQAPSPA